MKTILKIIVLFTVFQTYGQAKISGKVIDTKGKPLYGVNVFIEGTYDGATSNENGDFSFETTEKGSKMIIASALNYQEQNFPITIEADQSIVIKMKAEINLLDAVVISAGSFKAGDNSKTSSLKALDIVTTAGSAGDIVGALKTLPGAQVAGESGRLLVRGGESDETQTYIDGIRVAQPYGATANNLPTRGRFSPFLFNAMTSSTGGYSAEYGDALSSVLLMNSISEPDQDKADYSFMTVGLGMGRTKKWKKSSLSFNTSYINLQPYQWLVPQKVDWNKAYQGISGETVYRHKFERGLLKIYGAFDYSVFDLNQADVNAVDKVRISNKNNNFYFNSSYKGKFGSGWTLQTGVSLGLNYVAIGIDTNRLKNEELASHLKLKLEKKISNVVNLSFGSDYFSTSFEENFTPYLDRTFTSEYKSNIATLFAESDFLFSQKLATKVGFRTMYNDLLQKSVVEPRASLAFKSSKNGQFSLAYGDFHQMPKQDYLKYFKEFDFEKAQHYILNYTYSVNKRTLRTELYYKKYDNLIKYDSAAPEFNSNYNNNGVGYAKGLDIFWRDNKTVKNVDYWMSYSYIDSKRDYRNYTTEATPSFIAKHTLSLVGKYWYEEWKSQISVTNTFASGRPYHNPNEIQFMNGKTKNYNDLSIAWSYLLTQQKILFFSVSNVLGRDNVFGYQYANTPDLAGQYQRQAISQPAKRFFFVGFFWTISSDKKANQLDNL